MAEPSNALIAVLALLVGLVLGFLGFPFATIVIPPIFAGFPGQATVYLGKTIVYQIYSNDGNFLNSFSIFVLFINFALGAIMGFLTVYAIAHLAFSTVHKDADAPPPPPDRAKIETIEASKPSPPHLTQTTYFSKAYCTFCGEELREQDIKCRKCGTSIPFEDRVYHRRVKP